MSTEFIVTEELQAKVLAFMVHNPEFAEVSKVHLTQELFSNKALQWFFTAIETAPIHLSAAALREELVQAARSHVIKSDEVSKYIGLYDVIKKRPLPHEEEYLRDKMTIFIRTQAVKRAFEEGFDLAKSHQWDELASLMQEAVQAGMDLSDLGTDYFAEVEARILDRANREAHRRIPTGIPELDSLTYGGIKNGQVGLIVGGTGRGKSIFLGWLARTAVLLGKTVVYVSCELSAADIADRFDSMFAHIKINALNDYQQEIAERIGGAAALYGSNLWVKHYPTDTATVGTIKAYMRQLSSIGVNPDLVLIDYLDLLKPHRTYNSAHEEIDAIMKAVVGFSSEFDVSVYTATQLNRAGLVMDTPDESAMAGYVGKQYHADMVWWMAQKPDEKEDQIMRINISKNRNGPAGRTIKLDTDYAYMTFYKERLAIEEGTNNDEPGLSEEADTEPTPWTDHGGDGGGGDLQLLLEEGLSGQSDGSEQPV